MLVNLFLSIYLYAQPSDINFEHISIDHGLSQSTVFSIFQDSKGLIWLGTQDGLNLYDGYGFKIYKNDPENANSLSNNYVRWIYIDQDGVFWLGTDSGLNAFDPTTETFKHYKHEADNPNSLSHNKHVVRNPWRWSQ